MNKVEWSPTEVFEIPGFALETVVNILSQNLSSPEAQAIIKSYETLRALQDRIQKGIDEGKVKVIDENE